MVLCGWFLVFLEEWLRVVFLGGCGLSYWVGRYVSSVIGVCEFYGWCFWLFCFFYVGDWLLIVGGYFFIAGDFLCVFYQGL